MKNVNIYYSDYFIKVSIPSQKYILVIDLDQPINFKSPVNRSTYANARLDIWLEKQEKAHWDKLESDLPKLERMRWREESI